MYWQEIADVPSSADSWWSWKNRWLTGSALTVNIFILEGKLQSPFPDFRLTPDSNYGQGQLNLNVGRGRKNKADWKLVKNVSSRNRWHCLALLQQETEHLIPHHIAAYLELLGHIPMSYHPISLSSLIWRQWRSWCIDIIRDCILEE
jgi:hypothetical protein